MISAGITASAIAQSPTVTVNLSTPQARAQTVQALAAKARQEKAEAEAFAALYNLPVKGVDAQGRDFELMRLDPNGNPVYYVTDNVNAAISTAADQVRDSEPFLVDGSTTIVGVWDSDAVRPTHQEFGGRVINRDNSPNSDHGTHVGGTIGAAGVDPRAKGMAPAVTIYSYDWTSDESEMAANAMTAPGQADKIQISNHSYGTYAGWDGTYFYGNWPTYREDPLFGQYDSSARYWDTIVYDAGYYLPFKSAGNDRNDKAPSAGTEFTYSGNQKAIYDPATGPYSDGYDNGFDTVASKSVAKNIMTVGSGRDAVHNGTRDKTKAKPENYSGYGPADDGRIKPDILANGAGLHSTRSSSDTAYGSKSGTSMASPNAAGSAALLVDLYNRRLPGQAMRASTLKGLILHTATDVDRPGPDYRTGWGLMHTRLAAEQIELHAAAQNGLYIHEDVLTPAGPADTYTFLWDGTSPIRATLCWTDPPGPTRSGLDDRAPVLVNDLDLRLIAPDGTTTWFPYRLDPQNPGNDATTGDNTVDNVERIDLPVPPQTGVYTLTVTHKGSLTDGQQVYSLILNGQSVDYIDVLPTESFLAEGEPGGPFQPSSTVYTVTNRSESESLDWALTKTASWLDVDVAGGTLPPGASATVTVSLNAQADALGASPNPYADTLAFTNLATGASLTRDVRLFVAPNYWTEHFTSNDNDLDNLMLTLTPNGSGGYNGFVAPITELPSPPAGGTTLSLSDDSFRSIDLSTPVSIYDKSATRLYVGSNGYITFNSGDTDTYATIGDHFNRPRVSLLFDDLNPSTGGTVSWKELADRAVVSYVDVPEFSRSNRNTFQAELFFDGRIRLSWLNLDATDGLVGISAGDGEPSLFKETDISSYTAPVNTPPTAVMVAASTASPKEGMAMSVSGTFTDPDADPWSVTVDWGDGTAPTEVTGLTARSFGPIGHVYTDGDGTGTPRTITATVRDATDSADGTVEVTVHNVAPMAMVSTPLELNDDSQVTIDASSSSDPGEDALTFAWDLNNDGAFDDGTGPQAVMHGAEMSPGPHRFAVQVSDGDATVSAWGVVAVNDVTAPTSVGSIDDRTRAGGPLVGVYTATDNNGSGVAQAQLYVQAPGGVWREAGMLANGAWSHTPEAGDGVYRFAVRARDRAGNMAPPPGPGDSGDLLVLWNDVENSEFTHVAVTEGTLVFPMTDAVDVELVFGAGAAGGPVTMRRLAGDVAPEGLDAGRLIDEALVLGGTFGGGPARLVWRPDAAYLAALPTPVDTVFRCEDGTVTDVYTVNEVDGALVVEDIDAGGTWYAGSNNAAMPEWLLFD